MWTTTISLLTAAALAAGSPSGNWVTPLASGWTAVVQAFERPHNRFAPGHRGVDFSAPAGSSVRAIGPGRVAFVGDVAGTPTVSVEHPRSWLRSTYQPVEASVEVGAVVSPGDRLGAVVEGSKHCVRPCLHLGLKRPAWEARDAMTDPYVDPRGWIQQQPVLKPLVP
jgi:murein DD-endopeptidase MepM/ murein hydrolase activator NlpD